MEGVDIGPRLNAWRPKFAPPSSISAEAQAALMLETPARDYPDPRDLQAWSTHIAATNEAYASFWNALSTNIETRSTRQLMANVPVVRSTPGKREFPAEYFYLDIHGGALIYLGGEFVDPWARHIASRTQANVISIDYRMPPKYPYPAALDDCLAVYRSLLDHVDPSNIIVGGVSAGGNLAAALMLRARDEGLELPAALVLLTPELDLTESGDTFQTLLGVDRLQHLMPANRLYAAGAPLDHPYLSPLFGDLTLGFPPTFLQSGTRDIYLSNTVRMHRALRRAGVATELHIWEAMPHGGFLGAPEDDEVDDELRQFLGKYWL